MSNFIKAQGLNDKPILCFVKDGRIETISPAELTEQVQYLTTKMLAGIMNNTWKIENNRIFDEFNHINNRTYFIDKPAVRDELEALLAEGA